MVARRQFCKSGRGRRIVRASGTHRRLGLARLRRLQQGKAKFPIGCGSLLRLRRQRRNPAVGRIDHQRRARAGMLYGQKRRVVGTADVDRAATLLARVAAEQRSSLFVQFFPLLLGEKFLVRILGGAL